MLIFQLLFSPPPLCVIIRMFHLHQSFHSLLCHSFSQGIEEFDAVLTLSLAQVGNYFFHQSSRMETLINFRTASHKWAILRLVLCLRQLFIGKFVARLYGCVSRNQFIFSFDSIRLGSCTIGRRKLLFYCVEMICKQFTCTLSFLLATPPHRVCTRDRFRFIISDLRVAQFCGLVQYNKYLRSSDCA